MKATINSVTPKTFTKDGQTKMFQIVKYNGNLEAASFDSDFQLLIGQTVDVDIKTSSQGKVSIKLLGDVKTAPAPEQPCACKEPKAESDFNVRLAAITTAIDLLKVGQVTLTPENIKEKTLFIESYFRDGWTA